MKDILIKDLSTPYVSNISSSNVPKSWKQVKFYSIMGVGVSVFACHKIWFRSQCIGLFSDISTMKYEPLKSTFKTITSDIRVFFAPTTAKCKDFGKARGFK